MSTQISFPVKTPCPYTFSKRSVFAIGLLRGRCVVLHQHLGAGRQTRQALDLAGNDELRGLAVRHLLQRLQRLELDDLIVGRVLVQQAHGVCHGLLHLQDGLRLRLGGHDAGLLGGVRPQQGGLLLALGDQHLTGLLALGLQDGLAALALGLHLLFHGVLDLAGRQDVLQLHAVDLDAPRVGGLVQNGAHLGVDGVAAGEALVQLQLADDVTQGGSGQILDGAHGILHAVGVQLGIGDLEVDDRVDLHGDVVLGDDRLGVEVRHLLLEADLLHHPLDERQLEVQAHAPYAVEGAETLHHIGLGLLDDIDAADDDHQNENDQNDDGDGAGNGIRHSSFLLILFFFLVVLLSFLVLADQMDDACDGKGEDHQKSLDKVGHLRLLFRFHIQLDALHANDTHYGVRLDALPAAAAGRPRLSVYVDGAGRHIVVDALRDPGQTAQHTVGVGGLDVLFHQLGHQRAGGGQRDDGHHKEQGYLEPDRAVADGDDEGRHAAQHEPDGRKARRSRLHHAENDDGGDPDNGGHIRISSFQTQADQSAEGAHAHQHACGQPLILGGQVGEKCGDGGVQALPRQGLLRHSRRVRCGG